MLSCTINIIMYVTAPMLKKDTKPSAACEMRGEEGG
jgi:hypothetical protein